MTRGTQQEMLYTAEWDGVDQGPTLSVAEAQELVTAALQNEWWGRDYRAVAAVEVIKSTMGPNQAGCACLKGRIGEIHLHEGRALLQAVVHELAHVAAAARFGATGHDPAFARTYLELTYYLRGSEVWTALRTSFIKHGILWDTP